MNKEIPNIYKKKNPIDLYRFMSDLGKYTSKNDILITDAGSIIILVVKYGNLKKSS